MSVEDIFGRRPGAGFPRGPGPGSGGSQLGVRFALTVAAQSDSLLRPATKQLLALLAWVYVPGRVWRGSWAQLGRDAGLEGRTLRRAREQLVAQGYAAGAGDGWILPAVELALPPAERAAAEAIQVEMPWLDRAPAPVRRYVAGKLKAAA